MADRKISDLTALTTPASGDFLPIVDISEAAAASKNKRITIEELMRGVPNGTAAAPGIAFETDPNTGIFSPGADQLAISTGGTARLTSSTTALTSALPVDVPLGAAATPSLTFTGDLNTGIYSPGANQLAVATNGTGRLFIDADGNVGVGGSGASSPATYGNFVIAKNRDAAVGPHLVLGGFNTNSWANNEEIGAVDFWNNDAGTNGVAAQVRAIRGAVAGEGGLLTFSTRSTGVSTLQERLRITSAGLVGIGSSDPADKLEVVGDIRLKPASGANTLINFEYNNGLFAQIRGNGRSGSPVYGDLEFWTRNSTDGAPVERMVVSAEGRVGIGASAPLDKLDIRGHARIQADQNGNNVLAFGFPGVLTGSPSGASGNSFIVGNSSNVSGAPGYLSFWTTASGTVAERLRIASDGKVGIGTTSAVNSLVVSNSGAFGFEFDTNGGYLQTFNRSGAAWADLITRSATVQFRIQNSEKARIDTSGRFLVGTSSARSIGTQNWGIQQEGTTFTDTGISTTRNSANQYGSYLTFGKSRGAVGSNTVVANDDELGTILFAGADGSDVNSIAAWIRAQVDGTPGSNDMPGRLVFSTTADGAAGPTERMRITSNAYVRLAAGTGGIQFNGDTAAANALDDYEEGTFTPAVEGTTTVGAGTYSVQLGRYVKIGKTITVWIRLTWSAHTGTGDGAIAGLPFTSQTIGGGHHLSAAPIGYETNYNTAANTVLSAFVEPNGTLIRLAQLGVGTQSGGAAAALDAAAAVTVSATYEAAA